MSSPEPLARCHPRRRTGRMYVFFAHHDDEIEGLAPATVFGADNTIIGEASGNFGISVAMGDVNGDGFSDVIAGANLSLASRGRSTCSMRPRTAAAFPSTIDDLSGVRATTVTDANTLIIGEEASRLGSSLVVADLNGDGFADVVAGGPTFGGKRGQGVCVLFGGPERRAHQPHHRRERQHPRSTRIGGEFGAGAQLFGASVAVADVNGDGTADLVVGATGALNGAGVAYVFHSTPGVGPTQGNAINARGNGTQINGIGSVTLAFGASVSAGDVNGDGVMDVFAGAAANTDIAGGAFVFHATAGQGVPGGVNGTIRILDANTTLVGAAGSFFGSSIAR